MSLPSTESSPVRSIELADTLQQSLDDAEQKLVVGDHERAPRWSGHGAPPARRVQVRPARSGYARVDVVSRGRCEDGFSLHASAVEQARGLHDVRGAVRLDVEASDRRAPRWPAGHHTAPALARLQLGMRSLRAMCRFAPDRLSAHRGDAADASIEHRLAIGEFAAPGDATCSRTSERAAGLVARPAPPTS